MSAPASDNRRLQQIQAQVGEIVDTMRANVNKILERDEKLWELDNRADALQSGASRFEVGFGKLKRKYWRKDSKTCGFVIGILLIVVISIIVWNLSC